MEAAMARRLTKTSQEQRNSYRNNMLRYHDLYKATSNEAYNDSASLYRNMHSNPIV